MKVDQAFFDSMPISEKAVLLWEHGECLLTREYEGLQVNLYAMSGFYVEVNYRDDLLKIERIHSISAFTEQFSTYFLKI